LVNSHTQPNGVKEDWREKDWREVDLGPLVERKRGLKTRQRILFSGGMEMEVEPAAGEANGFVNGCKTPPLPLPNILFSGSPMPTPTSPSLRRKGKGKAVEGDGDQDLQGRVTLLKCTFFSFFLFISAILL
jgi:hypothetical protein